MATERTPEEWAADAATVAAVEPVISRAVDDLTSWHVAERLDLPAAVCESWVDRIWDGLRDALDPEDRILAILILLADRARAQADQILSGIGAVGGDDVAP